MVPVNPGLFLKITGTGIIITKKSAGIFRERDPGRSLVFMVIVEVVVFVIEVEVFLLFKF